MRAVKNKAQKWVFEALLHIEAWNQLRSEVESADAIDIVTGATRKRTSSG